MTRARAAFLQIEPTTRCNFTCGFCCGRHLPQEDLAWETFEATLAAFPEVRHVELQGEGESLLHPRFLEMCEVLRGRGIAVSFITNGSLLSERVIDRLLDLGPDKISVSIESPDPAVFREIRGGKLEKVVRNLERLMAERARRGLDKPVVGFSITVLERTKNDLPGILALYRRLGLDGGITLQPLQTMDSYAGHYDEALRAQHLDPATVEKLWLAFFADPEVRAIQASRGPWPGFYDELMEGWRPALRRCPYLDQGLYVHRTGDVTPCCMVKDVERHGLGRVGRDAPETILANRGYLADELASGRIPEACNGCELARFAVMSRWDLVRFGLRGVVLRFLPALAGLPRGRTPPIGAQR